MQASHRVGGARTVVRHGLVTGMLIAAILAVLAALISGPLPRWLHGDKAIRAGASAYFLTYALMVSFSQLNSLCASFLQSAGDMVSPSILNAVMCVLDVFFNALFIPRYGVSIVAAGALRGTGDTFVPSIMNHCSIWIVRLGLALVLVPRMGLRGMWIAMAAELCVRGLLMLFRQLTTKYYDMYKKEPV